MIKSILLERYRPSYLYSDTKTYKSLTDLYQNNISNFISSSPHEKERLFFGIEDIKKYVNASFYFGVNQKYDTKTPYEKVIYAIFFRYASAVGSVDLAKSEISQRILDIAELSIYLSLGIETYKKRNYKWDQSGNFIKHCIKKVFFSLLLDFFKEIESSLNYRVEEYTFIEDNSIIEDVLKTRYIPKENKDRIKKYLTGDSELDTLLSNDICYMKILHEDLVKT